MKKQIHQSVELDGVSASAGTARQLDETPPAGLPAGGHQGGLKSLLGPFLARHTRPVAIALAAMAVSATTTLSLGWGLKCVIDRGFADSTGRGLNQALAAMLAMTAVMAGASYVRLLYMNRVAEQLTAWLRVRVFGHLLSLDPAFHDNVKSGDLIARISADTSILQVLLSSQLPVLLRHGVMLAGGMAMLAATSPSMTGTLALAVPAVIVPLVLFGRSVRRKSRHTQDSLGQLTAYSVERLQAIRTIQSYGHESRTSDQFDRLVGETMTRALGHIRARALMTATVIMVLLSAVGVVLWAGGHKVLAGTMTAGDLSAFIFYAVMVAGSVMNISDASGEYNRASGAADRLLSILAAEKDIHDPVAPLALPPGRVEGRIDVSTVSFSYPGRPDIRAVDAISFSARPGTMTAIVGPSGAGKSTVFQLLQRFYVPQSGVIRLDGQDITQFRVADLRKQIAVVSQDPVIFSVSIADNIRLAKPEASDAEVQRAAEMAQAHDFIMALPQGYATEVGERGSQLSGGQKQRIAIARAFLKDSKILLLDEATSALDSENEKAIHFALKTLMRDKTTIVIAHRQATILSADDVVVMDKGRIVAEGTPDSLRQSGNPFFMRLMDGAGASTPAVANA